jgi:hypothetical protein
MLCAGAVWLASSGVTARSVQAVAGGDGAPTVESIIAAYVKAIGGQAVLDTIQTRVTRGLYDNGRASVESFATYIKPPDRVVVVFGRASLEDPRAAARGFDGREGWDKNVLGAGLRNLTGLELTDVARTADIFRPVRLPRPCAAVAVQERGSSMSRMNLIRCTLAEGSDDWFFDAKTGLLARLVATASETAPSVNTFFEDYRLADGVSVPFRTRIVTPDARLTFAADTIRHNEPVDDRVFKKPPR